MMNRKQILSSVKSCLEWARNKSSQVPYIAALSYSFSFVLLVYRKHIFNIPVGEVFIPLAISFLIVHISYKVFQLIINDKNSAGAATLLLSLFIVQFDLIFTKVAGIMKRALPIESSYDVALVIILTLGVFIALIILSVMLKKRKKLAHGIRKFLDVSFGVYFLITAGTVLFMLVANYRIFTFKLPERNIMLPATSSKPDIYYFVFDRYAGEETLNKYYDFSNKDFIEEMKSRGFIFNEIKNSNYPYTPQSISSTFNADYLDKYVSGLPPKYSESVYNEIIDNNYGIATLKDSGYEYHHIGSWWGATRTSELADVSYTKPFQIRILGRGFVVSDFQDQLLRQHMFRRFLAADVPVLRRAAHYRQPLERDIVKYQLDSVKTVIESANQKNVVSMFHVLSPHPQYVFDKDGSVPSYNRDANYGDIPEKIKYINQLQYINDQILTTVDYILENSEDPPIIIFQPDEGPHRYKDIDDSSLSRSEKMKWKYGITSAFYLPDYKAGTINLSPVNIFPFLFNHYFEQQLELQENRNYWYDKKNPYYFQDITDLINQES